MSHRAHRNRRELARGTIIRASDVQSHRGRSKPCHYLRWMALPPTDGPVDGQALAAEVARLADVGRRKI